MIYTEMKVSILLIPGDKELCVTWWELIQNATFGGAVNVTRGGQAADSESSWAHTATVILHGTKWKLLS